MAPFIRIVLRYFAAAMLAAGYFNEQVAQTVTGDQELVQFIVNTVGIIAAGVAEGWYWLSRKMEWSR